MVDERVTPNGNRMTRASAMGIAVRPVARVGASSRENVDVLAVEEPLEIRIDGERIATTMRTPGNDARLALGFLFGEGIIGSLADVGTIAHCGRLGSEGSGNVIEVRSGPGVSLDAERILDSRRFLVTGSACGVCGRRSIDALVTRVGTVEIGPALLPDVVARSVESLRAMQPNFARSGGVHAAAAFDRAGGLLSCQEDVGRHNAVDKVIGELVYRRLVGAGRHEVTEGRPALLAVSGRSSFEIVQKAAAAGIGVVASVSAASSLAVDLASAARITLAAFVRGGALNVYTHPERLGLSSGG